MDVQVEYLHHSGFAVKLQNHCLVFDYDVSGILPRADCLTAGESAVFVSHRHGDHYSRQIFDWKQSAPQIQYILSDDIPSVPGTVSVGPDRTIQVGDLVIHTFRSTDEGVAFLVECEGKFIYHAGDLNWWHWNGESEAYNCAMKQAYLREIQKLTSYRIDLAFVPVDPRLEDAAYLGLLALLDAVNISHVIPMHFWEDTAPFDTEKQRRYLPKEKTALPDSSGFHAMTHPGEQLLLTL